MHNANMHKAYTPMSRRERELSEEPYEGLLRLSGRNKAQLGRELGLTAGTVSRWGVECPGYVRAYLVKAVLLGECEAMVRAAGRVA